MTIGGVFFGICDFSDVPVAHPYYEAIMSMAGRGIIDGYTNGQFGLTDPVKRAQFAKMIVGTLGIAPSASTATRFTDLGTPDTKGYPHIFVQAAYENGVTKGTDTAQTLFGPWDPIRRDQAVSMIVRGVERLTPGTLAAPSAGTASHFAGVPEPHGANLRTAEYNGLLDGLLGTGPSWQNYNATRGEVAHMLSNLLTMMQSTVPETTKVLGAAALLELMSVSSDQSVLVFAASPSTPVLVPGDVVVAGVSALTPSGLLRRVTGVSNDSSTVTVRTVAAALQDAIPEGSFSVDVTLSPDTTNAACLGEVSALGESRLEAAALTSSLGVSISLEDIPWGVRRLNISGSTSLSEPPNIKFRAKWGRTGLEASADFATQVKSTLTASTSVGSVGSGTWNLLKEPYRFKAITLYVSGLPVVLVPTLQFQLKASGGFSTSMSKSIVHTARLTAGLDYTNGRVIPRSDFSSTFSNPLVSPSTTAGHMRVSVGPVVTLAVYGVAGPSLTAGGFLDLSVQPTETPPWVLSGGLQAGIGFDIPFLKVSASIPNLIEWSESILEGSQQYESDAIRSALLKWFIDHMGTAPEGWRYSVDLVRDQWAAVFLSVPSWEAGFCVLNKTNGSWRLVFGPQHKSWGSNAEMIEMMTDHGVPEAFASTLVGIGWWGYPNDDLNSAAHSKLQGVGQIGSFRPVRGVFLSASMSPG